MSAIALLGAQGTGKSTLAKAYAESRDWAFVPSPGSACFKELNLPFVGLSFEDRLRVQELILQRMSESFWAADRQGGEWISDRSPLDLAAYMIAEWGQRATAAQGTQILDYVERCFAVMNLHVSMLVLVQPGIAYDDDGSRPPANVAGQWLHNMLCFGYLRDHRCRPFALALQETTLDLTLRVQGVHHYWENYLRQCAVGMADASIH